MSLANLTITLNIQNNTNYPQQINVLGNPYNPLDTVNAQKEYRWNVTGFTFTTENSVLVQYKSVNDAVYSTYTSGLASNTLQGVIDALNGLQIGYFNLYTELGQTYIGTYNDNYNFADLSIYEASIIDNSLIYGTGFDAQTFISYTLPNGKILIGGSYTNYNGTAANSIIQLNNDGSVDSGFIYGSGFNGAVNSIAMQSDGKILVGGDFSLYNGSPTTNLVRLNTDGSLDNTFIAPPAFVGDTIKQIIVLSNGQILYAYNNTIAIGYVSILNNDGTVYAGFNTGGGFDSEVYGIAIQSNGEIIVAGMFTTYDVYAVNGIVRLNNDGTYDSTFNQPFPIGTQIFSIAIQPDDKIIAGVFDTINNLVSRLNPDGYIDSSFVIGYLDSSIRTVNVSSVNGNIFCGGFFQNYSLSPSLTNPISSNRILQLDSFGNYKTNWQIGSAFDSTVNNIEFNNNQSAIICTGSFTTFNGITANSIIRLLI